MHEQSPFRDKSTEATGETIKMDISAKIVMKYRHNDMMKPLGGISIMQDRKTFFVGIIIESSLTKRDTFEIT